MADGLECQAFRPDRERPLGDVRIAEMSRSWSRRWDRLKAELTMRDLALDVTGKMLVALGLGALWASVLRPSVWCLIGAGVLLSAVVKVKYWKRFWS